VARFEGVALAHVAALNAGSEPTHALSRLWQQRGKRAEACVLLAPIYNWFSEGFDTKDLKEAKGLLDELR
jgi:predicted ATPase